jgi:hypothetical protein
MMTALGIPATRTWAYDPVVTIRMARMRRPARSEEGEAAERVIVFVSVVVGAMLTLFESVAAFPMLVALATLGLAVALVLRATGFAPWAALALWATILIRTEGWALVPPLMMMVLCLALAMGPDRLLDWMRDEWNGRDVSDPRSGWIEDV